MKKSLHFYFLAIALLLFFKSEAYIPTNSNGKPLIQEKNTKKKPNTVLLDCAVSKSYTDLNVNNVRARLQGGGDLWWDFKDGKYIVPNVPAGMPPISSIFAGAIWMGGIDAGGNLKTACNMYRGTSSNDWWPGPLDNVGQTTPTDCNNWDKHFSVYKTEIETFKEAYNNAAKDANGKVTDANFTQKIPKNLLVWPATGNPFFEKYNGFSLPATTKQMAYFWDNNNDDTYNPFDGDYPAINVGQTLCTEPDQFVFWIFNDAGGIHTSSKSEPLRVEVQATSFAYATDDDLNNMTFQHYKTIYRGSQYIDSCFLAHWVDFDLGCPADDYLGFDNQTDYMGSKHNMVYAYNSDNIDGFPGNSCAGIPSTYGNDIPMIGIDFLQLPKDQNGKEVGTSFMYFNNSIVGEPPPATTDPFQANDFYRYMNGVWKDGTPLSIGGSGYTQNPDPKKITKHAFPDDPNNPDGWSMYAIKKPSVDLRFVLSAGAFKLVSGAVQNITFSIPWVSHQGGGEVDLTSLRRSATRARELFNRCFDLTGPSAPNVSSFGLDKAVVLNLENQTAKTTLAESRFEENYKELSFSLPNNAKDIYYKFEGYKIYQVKDENIPIFEVEKSANARLVAVVDVVNGVKKIYNWTAKKDPNDSTFPSFSSELQADGEDKGINRSFYFDKDAFATSTNKGMVNGQKYHYVVVPYAYNNFQNFSKLTGNGQKQQYLKGFLNSEVVTIIPNGAMPAVKYGTEIPVTRYDGVGAGGNFLDMTDDMHAKIFDKTFDGKITYKAGKGPIKVKVADPVKLQDGEYTVRLLDANMKDGILQNDAKWELQRKGDKAILSATSIENLNEQLLSQYGLSISIAQQKEPCSLRPDVKGIIGQEISFENNKEWLKTIKDDDENVEGTVNFYNYIKNEGAQDDTYDCLNYVPYDKSLLKFAPYVVCDYRLYNLPEPSYITPAWVNNANSSYYIKANTKGLAKLSNVDIVLTADKSKWSRCVVVETINEMYQKEGLESEKSGVLKGRSFDMRAGKSVGSDTNPDAPSDGTLGKGWFPGYAINVETGERLNIIFGENSGYDPDNALLNEFFTPSQTFTGRDMIWNPTNDVFVKGNVPAPPTATNLVAGCGHYIYVTDTPYDGCAELYNAGVIGSTAFSRNVAKAVAWTAMPYLKKGEKLLSYKDGLIPSKCTIKLRVNNPYDVAQGVGTNNLHPIYGFSVDAKTLNASLLDNKNEINFNIYPNPITNENTLALTNLPTTCSINIYGLDGKLHFQTKRKTDTDSDNTMFISNLNLPSAGVYLVTVRTANGIQCKKLVVH